MTNTVDSMIFESRNSRTALDSRSRLWYIGVAKELYYPRKVISALRRAATEAEAERIMRNARLTY